jgi:hypothetical protein
MRNVLIASALLLASAGTSSASHIFWDPGAGGNGHFYHYFDIPSTWDEAFAAAAADGGYLATVTSLAENDFIHDFVTDVEAWLGGTDRDVEGVWRWMNGPELGDAFPPGFTYWAAGEPNDCCAGEDDLVINWDGDGRWNDIGLPSFPHYRVGYVVEYDGREPVAEPATLLLLGAGLAGAGRRFARRRS